MSTNSFQQLDTGLFPVSSDMTLAIEEAASDSKVLLLLPPARFVPSSTNPRTQWEEGHIEETAVSIADLHARGRGIGGTGYLQAIMVRLPSGVLDSNGALKQSDFQFPIAAGETRWRAGNLLATTGVLDKRNDTSGQLVQIPDLLIPAYIENVNEDEARELGYYENKKRRNLSSLDEAVFLSWMKKQHGLTLQGVANRIGESIGYVQNRLDLIQAQPDVQDMVAQRPNTLAIARRIDRVTEEKDRKKLIQMVLDGVPYRQVETQIDHLRTLNAKTVAPSLPENATPGKTSYGQPAIKNVPRTAAIDPEVALNRIYDQASSLLSSLRDVKPLRQQKEGLISKTTMCREVLEQITQELSD